MTNNNQNILGKYQLKNRFEVLCRVLRNPKFSDRVHRPLYHWALPEDRQLPVTMLNRSIWEVINTTYEKTCAPRGIGYKKICGLIKLLTRVTKDAEPKLSLVDQFDLLCRRLRKPRFSDRIHQPLFNWALPVDRQLPIALLNRSIWQVINTTYEKISSCRGIGDKKVSGLIRLLTRVTEDPVPEHSHEKLYDELVRSAYETQDSNPSQVNPS